MENVINLAIPHIAERIFNEFGDTELIQFRGISKTWKQLTQNVLIQRWNGKEIAACAKGKTIIVKLLLHSTNIDWNKKDCSGWTPLMYASSNGHTDVVNLLISYSEEKNIDFNVANRQGRTSLMFACLYGHLEIVKLILKLASIEINAKDVMGDTAFHWACEKGHLEMVKLLIQHSNIDVHTRNLVGATGFTTACSNKRHEIVRFLVKSSDFHGVDLNAKDKDGMTGFMWICVSGHIEMIKFLMDSGQIDLNARDARGRTALIQCCQCRNLTHAERVAKLLLDYSEAKNIFLPTRHESEVFNFPIEIIDLLKSHRKKRKINDF